MKKNTKKTVLTILSVVLAVLLLVGALLLAQALVTPKYQSGVVEGAMTAEYYNETSGHEVLMVGDCEVYENISTIELWRKYGITSYIRGSAQQLVWQSYYLLEDALRYETPKVVVFNVLALKYDKPQSEAYNRMSIEGMRWSASKIGAIRASMTEDEKFTDYLFPLLRYHARWSELTDDDFRYLFKKDLVTHNGYYMRVDVRPQDEFPDPQPLADYTLGSNAMSYLDKMTELCAEKGIRLVLMKAPVEWPYWYKQWDAQIVSYAEEHGLDYLNFLDLRDEAGIDMSTDTYDAGLHLNLYGAEKLADCFGAWLVENCGLTDGRENEKTARLWAEKEARYEEEKADQLRQIAEYGKVVSRQPAETKESNVMKNFICWAVVAALCLTLIACTAKTPAKTAPSGETPTASVPSGGNTPTEPAKDGYYMVVKNVRVDLDAPMAPIAEKLGEPTKYYESESCAYQGLDKVYTYGGVIIRTYPQDGVDYVLSVQLKDDSVLTPEGVGIGDDAAKVKEVYGEPTSTTDVAMRYAKGDVILDIFITDGSVSDVTYTKKD